MSAPAIPKDVLNQIRDLQERLAKAEADRDALREALRPFANASREAKRHFGFDPPIKVTLFLDQGHFARATELIPE